MAIVVACDENFANQCFIIIVNANSGRFLFDAIVEMYRGRLVCTTLIVFMI